MIQCRFCDWLRRVVFFPICGPILFNSDMSLKVDSLIAENERLRAMLAEALRRV